MYSQKAIHPGFKRFFLYFGAKNYFFIKAVLISIHTCLSDTEKGNYQSKVRCIDYDTWVELKYVWIHQKIFRLKEE